MSKTYALLLSLLLLASLVFGQAEKSMIVIIPDTQNYAKWKRSGVSNQINWIIENQTASNILFVGHVGDIVNDYDKNPDQWAFMSNEYARVAAANIPYAVTSGNHDYVKGTRDSTMMNAYFPLSSFAAMPTYGGSYDAKSENTYHIVKANNLDWLIISLEFGPRSSVIEWANSVVTAHSNNPAILITHSYLSKDGERTTHSTHKAASLGFGLGSKPLEVNDGEDIWNALVYSNSNVRLVVSGHDGATDIGARLQVSTNTAGRKVCEVLTNYQYFNAPSYSGFMLLVHLDTKEGASFTTYSPTLKLTSTNAESFGSLDVSDFYSTNRR